MFFVCLFVFHIAWHLKVPQTGVKPVPLEVEAESLNHWAAREVPWFLIFK